MKRVIVIEGPDGAGKSTLAKALVESYGLELIHTGGPLKDQADFEQRERELKLLTKEPRIYDRVPYVSDLVYAFLNARDPIVQPHNVSMFLQFANPIIIYCRLSSSAEMLEYISMEKKAHKPPEYMEKVKASHPALVASYDKVIHDLQVKSRALVIRFNWRLDSLSSLKFSIDGLT